MPATQMSEADQATVVEFARQADAALIRQRMIETSEHEKRLEARLAGIHGTLRIISYLVFFLVVTFIVGVMMHAP